MYYQIPTDNLEKENKNLQRRPNLRRSSIFAFLLAKSEIAL